MRLGMTVGYRVFCCENLAFSGDFEPIAAKHSKNFKLIDSIESGVAQMQRSFEPMVKNVDRWRDAQISDVTAKMYIYQAFVEGCLDVPRHLSRMVHQNYFSPTHADFQPRTLWSLSNAFTSSFKELDQIPAYKATAALAEFLKPL